MRYASRSPQTVTLYSLKEGIDGEEFQISRVIHSLTPDLEYVCTLYLTAALRSNCTYEPGVSPTVSDFGMSLANLRRKQAESGLNSLRNMWT